MFPDAQIRTQPELVLLATLGPALMATKGMAVPEVEHTYTRARELCRQVGETPQLASVLFGLQTFYLVQGDYETSRELGQQLFDHAQCQHEAELFLLAHQALGSASFFQGELPVALDHFEQGITLYDAQRHRNLAFRFGQDSGMQCFSYAAWTLWLLGYPGQAVARIDDTLTLAKELSHPFSLARGLHYAAVVAQFRREGQSAHERAESTMTLATEQELVQWLAGASLMQGWALAVQGQHDKGQAQLCRGLAAWRATGAEVMQPYYLTLLADLHRIGGQANEGLSLVAEALTLVEKNRERLWEAEIHRLKGELLLSLSSDNYTAAESCFQKALEISRHQEAKSLELRAATSLANLWQSQGKREGSAYVIITGILVVYGRV